jgi:hypothetical protein
MKDNPASIDSFVQNVVDRSDPETEDLSGLSFDSALDVIKSISSSER